jgi:hypothetical protein
MSTPFLYLARPDGVLCVSSYRGRTCGKATRIDLQTPSHGHGTGRALPWLLKAASAELRAGVTRRC